MASFIHNGAFRFTPDDFAAVASIKSDVIRRILQDRLTETHGLLARYVGDRFLKLETNLSCWGDFVQQGRVRTSYGTLTSADLPSILSAIAIIDPIVAAIRGERVDHREVA
ncbi:hypothetical protein [Labrys neptuniae]